MFRECRKRVICVGLALLALLGIGWRGYCAGVPFGGEQYLIGAVAAYPADLDRDGDVDLVVPSARVGGEIYSLVWLENDGGAMPQFTRHDIATTSTMSFFCGVVGDLNGDGWPDLVDGLAWPISLTSPDTLVWYENDRGSPPGFVMRNAPPVGEEYVLQTSACGDINGDGANDVLSFCSSQNPQLILFMNDGAASPTFTSSSIHSDLGLEFAQLADLDGDGRLDLLVDAFDMIDGYVYSPRYLWYQNQGGANPSFARQRIQDSTPWIMNPADIDNDGDIDLMTASRIWLENDGATSPTFTVRTIAPSEPFTDFYGSCLADFNKDGNLDMASIWQVSNTARGYTTSYNLVWYENKGTRPATFTQHAIDRIEWSKGDKFNPGLCAAADLDGDGAPDLITGAEGTSEHTVVWRKNLLTSNAVSPSQWTLME